MAPDRPDRPDRPDDPAPLLSVRDLVVQFRVRTHGTSGDGWLTAVDGLSYDLYPGETLGIVGESGSGKSVTNLAVMRLLPTPSPARITRGRILFRGEDLLALAPAAMRRIRGAQISMIFQDPMTSLNPFMRVGAQLTEMLEIHRGVSRPEARDEAVRMLERVGIPDAAARFRHYPHQFSGGMRQRVMIAMMLLNAPALLIADEPTTALDVTIQAQILELLAQLQAEDGMAITLITHDLGVVAGVADHVLVLYAGKTMEAAPTAELFARPRHPYTLGLLRSLPRVDRPVTERLYSIPGRPPDLEERGPGCPFAPRCDFVRPVCHERFPDEARPGAEGHRVYCHAHEEVAR